MNFQTYMSVYVVNRHHQFDLLTGIPHLVPEEMAFKILLLAPARRIRIPTSELKHQSYERKIDSHICVTENEAMFFLRTILRSSFTQLHIF